MDSGADVIAHIPGFWPDIDRLAAGGAAIYRIDEDAAETAAERGVAVVTTLGEGLRGVAGEASLAPFSDDLLAVYRHNIEVLQAHGVRIAIGSDQFRASSIEEALELDRFDILGRVPLLRALTIDAAAVIFPDRVVGPVEGARADFVVLDQNPLQAFSNVTTVRHRIKDGRILSLSSPPE